MKPGAAIPRVQQLTPERFVRDYVCRNTPVIVTDALADWELQARWTPAYLNARFGDEPVQVYNDYFDLLDLLPLSDYLQRHGGDGGARTSFVPYVRWYSKFRDVDFAWADTVFERLRDNWARPYFLPDTDFLLPLAPPPQTADPVTDAFPAKALFISGPGARTGLHVDPWSSDAVLCQVFGRKAWLMYAPDQSSAVTAAGECVDPDDPDPARFPHFDRVVPRYVFTLHPGESVYVPHGWFHHVRSETMSISLSWNFVHSSTAEAFLAWLAAGPSARDLSVLHYFFGGVAPDVLPAAIRPAIAALL